MIDMHSHVLPYVDDGSQDIQDSLEMIRQSEESGVKILVVTPHSNQQGRFENYYRSELKQRFLHLKKAAENEGLKTRLIIGMEIFSSPDLADLIETKYVTGLNCSDYYLIEFPFEADITLMDENIEMVFESGGIPVIAHPERYIALQQDPTILYDWIQEGVCTQVNKGSILGGFGRNAKMLADIMYRHDLVTCVGSDAHSTDVRTTDMSLYREYMLERYSKDYFRKITRENSLKILKNQKVPVHGIKPDPRTLPRIKTQSSRRKFHFWDEE